MYSNCSCIPDGLATAGFCSNDCWAIYPWAVVNFLASVFGAMKIMPNFVMIIRYGIHNKSLFLQKRQYILIKISKLPLC